ncbi:MAG: hypothetical protein ABJE10_05415 [bacterium]
MRPYARLIFVAVGIILGACAGVTEPTHAPMKPTAAARFDIDSSMCRSGYNISQGRCN